MGIIKSFFGPTWEGAIIKVGFGIILFIIATYINDITWTVADYWAHGWPLAFYETWGPCIHSGACQSTNIFALILDIFFWYLIACIIALPFTTIIGKSIKSSK